MVGPGRRAIKIRLLDLRRRSTDGRDRMMNFSGDPTKKYDGGRDPTWTFDLGSMDGPDGIGGSQSGGVAGGTVWNLRLRLERFNANRPIWVRSMAEIQLARRNKGHRAMMRLNDRRPIWRQIDGSHVIRGANGQGRWA